MAALIFARAGLVRIVRPVSDFYVAGRLMPAFFNGVAIAASSVAALVFVGAFGAVGFDWAGVTAPLLGGGLGLILAGLLLAPYLRSYGGYTVPDFLAERFGGDKIRPLAVLALILCSFPALATVLLAFGLLTTAVFPLSATVGVGAGIAFIFVATLIGGMRSLSLSQIAYYAVLFAAGLAAVVVLWWQTGSPFTFDTVLVDEVVPTLGLKAFAQSSPANTFALVFCLAAGVASLPYLLMRSFTTPSAVEARVSFLVAPLFVLMLCVAAPAFAALYEAARVASGDTLSMIAQAVLVVGAIAGLLATGAALTLAIGNALSYDIFYKTLQPSAHVGRQMLVSRLAVVAVAGLAGLAAIAAPEEILTGTAAAFSLAASAFLPVLVLGVWWKRTSSDAALAGMAAGLVVCLYYMIAPHAIPFLFYESSGFLSDATALQVAAYEGLRHDYYLAADGAAQAAVLAKWDTAVRPMANWLGVHGTLAGVFAVPVGFVVTIVVSLFTHAPSKDVQRFVKTLRARTA
jgi:cation/acetate symporter